MHIREPMGWYKEFCWVDTPSVFVRFVERNSAHFACCANSESSIDVDFNDKSDKKIVEESRASLDECIHLIINQNEAQDDSQKLIQFTRLWWGFTHLTGHCVSCNCNLLQIDDITCNFCLADIIILEEVLHCYRFWNNVGDFTFLSKSLPSLTTRNILREDGQNMDYMTCLLGCKKIGSVPNCAFSLCYKEVKEGKSVTTWFSMTNLRYYFLRHVISRV